MWDQAVGSELENRARRQAEESSGGSLPERRWVRRRFSVRRWKHRLRRRWREIRCLSSIIWHELIRTRALDVAGGLAFWSMMSMIPLLMAVVALFSFLPIPHLLPTLLSMVAILVPPSALALVEKLAGSLLVPHSGVLSFGILSYIWSSTGGFTALIAALNIAYDVKKQRSWIRDRIQAIILTFTSGGLLTLSIIALIVGPDFAHLVASVVQIPGPIEKMWPLIRYGTVILGFVLSLELCYFLGPNMRQRFRSTIPGAILAIVLWIGGSFGLSFYLNHLSNYSRLYGELGAIFGLMLWVYLTCLAVLVGAETNAEIAKRRDSLFRGHVQESWGRRKPRKAQEASAALPGRPAA